MAGSINISIDLTLNCAYIRLSDATVARTVEYSDLILVDVDEHDVAVGIELLDESAPIPFTALCRDFHVHSRVVDLLRLIRPDVETFRRAAAGGTLAAAHHRTGSLAHSWAS